MRPDPGSQAENLRPLVIVPGFCSSCLEVEKSLVCPSWEGYRAWLSLSRLGFSSIHSQGLFESDADKSLKNKWLEHMALKSPTEEHDGIRLKAVEGVEGIKSLDSESFFGLAAEASFVFLPVVKALEAMGYEDGLNMAAASYDWRFAPSVLQRRDGYFDRLMAVVERLDVRGTGVVLLGHSMGNKTVAYFLQHVKRKAGGPAWLQKHVYSWIAAGAPFIGSPQAVRCTILGDKFNLDAFITDSEALYFARSLSASPWLFPVGSEEEKPVALLRRGGLLEVRNFQARVPHCGVASAKNSLQLSVEIDWGEGSEKEYVTTKSATHMEGGVAHFDPALNLLHFGGGPPDLVAPEATITVVVKEKGIRDDSKASALQRFSKGILAGVQILGEAAHGRKSMGVPKATTESYNLARLLRGQRHRDGFVDVRLPIASVKSLGWGAKAEDYSRDFVTLQVRWLDYRTLRKAWLGSQELAPPPARSSGGRPPAALPRVQRKGGVAASYDCVYSRQLVQMESPEVAKVVHDYYDADATYDSTGHHDCPPIQRVVAIHGVNVPTEVGYVLRVNTLRVRPHEVQTRLALDPDSELQPGAPANVALEGGILREMPATGEDEVSGDGVVPIASMEHCKDWSGRLELKVMHLDGVEHRGMLADPRFHLAIQEAVVVEEGAPMASGGSCSSSGPPRARPHVNYSVAGTWSDWAPSPMEWDGHRFFSLVRISKQGWESFQILLNGSWDTVLYPSVKSANPSVEHELRGPNKDNKGFDWTIGRPGFNPLGIGRIMPGTEYKIMLEVDSRGHAKSVTWDLHLTVQVFAKADAKARHKWQTAKSEREWWDCPEEVSQQLFAAQSAGLRKVRLRVHAATYDFDLQRMVQRNLLTGRERAIRAVSA